MTNKREGKGILKFLRSSLLVAVIVSILTIGSICFAGTKSNDVVVQDVKISGYSIATIKGVTYANYTCYLNVDGKSKAFSIDGNEYEFSKLISKYKDDLLFRVSYSKKKQEIIDCELVNGITGEIIKNQSDENMQKLFDIEYGKNIIQKTFPEKIKLSELVEGEVYEFVAVVQAQMPEIENDIDKNGLIYVSDRTLDDYKKKIMIANETPAISATFSYSTPFEPGESFKFMYKTLETEALLKMIDSDNLVRLSEHIDGGKIDSTSKDYIYNDTQDDIRIDVKNVVFGQEMSGTCVIPKGEVWISNLFGVDEAVLTSVQGIKVKLNGKYIDFTDSNGNRVDPQLINSRTMVPMRKIFEMLGAEVEWDAVNMAVGARTKNLTIILQIDNTTAYLVDTNNDIKEIVLDSAPIIVEGRTLVPVRFIAESLNKLVEWEEATQTVIITDKK